MAVPSRTSWKGFIKLSLVSVPVKAFTANDSSGEVRLNQLHKALANTLIGASKINEFDFNKYNDQYVAKLKKVIDLEIQGAEIVQAPDHEEPKILNLMDALKKSVAAAQPKLVVGQLVGEDVDAAEGAKVAPRKQLAPSTGSKKRSRKVGN